MTDANTICHDLDLLDDWLAGKGYGEEAGLVLRALSLIHKLQDGVRSTIQERDVLSGENFDLRAENEKLRAALKPLADEVEYVPSRMDDDDWYEMDTIKVGHIRAARAAIEGEKK